MEDGRGIQQLVRHTATGLNSVLCAVWVEGGRRASPSWREGTRWREVSAEVSAELRRLEAPARNEPGMDQQQREVENSISITMQSYTHVVPCDNGPGVTWCPVLNPPLSPLSSTGACGQHGRLTHGISISISVINCMFGLECHCCQLSGFCRKRSRI